MVTCEKNTVSSNEKICKNNQLAYIAEAGLEYFISILVTGTFLAAILKNIGVPDTLTGITTALYSLSFSSQLIAVMFIHPKKSVGKFVTIFHLVNQLMFVLLYALPYVGINKYIKLALFVVMFLGGNFISNSVLPFKISWLMSYVDDKKRGSFTANKEIVSLLGGIVFSFAMGAVIDYFKAINKIEIGFLLCGITLFMLCILHLISLLEVRKKENEEIIVSQTYNYKTTLKNTLFDKQFRKIIILDCLWHIGTGISTSFFGTYQINELGFSLKYAAILSAVYSAIRVLFSKFFGKMADKYSWSKMLMVCFAIGSLSLLINTFTVPSNGKIFYAVYYSIYAIYHAGANSGIMNITFDYTTHENRAAALGVKSAIGGIFGFLASLAGGEIVYLVQGHNNIVFGKVIYAQQILSFIAFAIFLMVVFYIKNVICKIKQN